MNVKSKSHIENLRELYSKFNDKDSLEALDRLEMSDAQVHELRIYREHWKTIQLADDALRKYKKSLIAISTERDMSDEERTLHFVSMDWAKWYLEQLGISPDVAEKQVDEMVEEYARRAGISTD